MTSPRSEPQTAAGREAKRIFGSDVEWAAHPDPMTGEDWDRVADLIVKAAAPSLNEGSPRPPEVSE